MMEAQHDILATSFKPWKIWVAVGLGLLIAIVILFSGVRQVQFVKVTNGKGDYAWKDANQNGKIDIHNSHEFIAVTKGDYIKQRASDALKQLEWSSSSILWIFIAILFMVGRDLFYMIRIRVLTHKKLGWKSSFHVIMLWEFASALSPGVVGGAAVAMFILNREKIPLGHHFNCVPFLIFCRIHFAFMVGVDAEYIIQTSFFKSMERRSFAHG